MGFKKNIFHAWINMTGWTTKKKLVLFQSDDWGGQRMPSKEVYNSLNGKLLDLESCPYSLYDSLENSVDVENLFNTLIKFKDSNGNPPCITLNFLTANPDYLKIAESDFTKYFYRDLNYSYERLGNSPKDILFKGVEHNTFEIQFHGREHLNTTSWLELLRTNDIVRKAAESGFYFLSFANLSSLKIPYLASFIEYGEDYARTQSDIFKDGLELFNSFFGFLPTSFVAPVYVTNPDLVQSLKNSCVKSIQGLYREVEMSSSGVIGQSRRRSVLNKNGQINLIRNGFFEPSLSPKRDWVNEVLKEMEIAFMFNKPAIISTHRLNYIGRIDKDNSVRNLMLLEDLIAKIVIKWPDIEFINTEKLSNLIRIEKNVL